MGGGGGGGSGINSENGVGKDFLEEEVRDLGRPVFYTLLMALGGLGSWGCVAHLCGHSHQKKSSKRQGDAADGGGRLRRQKRAFEQGEKRETPNRRHTDPPIGEANSETLIGRGPVTEGA